MFLDEVIDLARNAGEIDTISDVVDSSGFKLRLLSRFDGWSRAELSRDSTPAETTPGTKEIWRLYRRYRVLLEEFGLVDEALLSIWASRQSILDAHGSVDRFRQITFLNFDPYQTAQWRFLENACASTHSVRASLIFESNPDRSEAFEARVSIRRRLISLGFAEEYIEADMWRPQGLHALESSLFRMSDGAPFSSPPITDTTGIAIRGGPQGDGLARLVAREVRQILDRGASPEDILVLSRQRTPQTELIHETLQSWGIPTSSQHSRPLSADPAVATLLLAMRIPAENWNTDLLVYLLRNGLLRPRCPHASPRKLLNSAWAIQSSRVFRGGPDLLLKAINGMVIDRRLSEIHRERAESSREFLTWLLGILGRLDRRLDRLAHIDRILHLAEDLGLDQSDQTRKSLDEFRYLLEEHAAAISLVRGEDPSPTLNWSEYVLETTRLVADTTRESLLSENSGAVRLSTVEEARGATAKFVLLTDLEEGTFPIRQAVEPFLALKPGDNPDEKTRLGYSRELLLFLETIGSAEDCVAFFYPTTDHKGQKLLRAGFLDEVISLLSREAESRCHDSYTRFHPAFVDHPDLARSAADQRVLAITSAREFGDFSKLRSIPSSQCVRRALEGVADALLAIKKRGYKTRFSEFDGLLRDDAAIVDIGSRFNRDFLFSPSQLETYIGCPFQFFAKYVMRLELRDDRDELDEDFTERGSRIHGLLQKLEENRQNLAESHSDDSIGRIALNELLSEELVDATGVEFGLRQIENLRLGRILKRYQVQHREYVDGSPSKPEPLGFEMKFGQTTADARTEPAHPPLELGEGDLAVKIQGMIDRIDILQTSDGPAFRVIDYKSGLGPSSSDVKSGRMVQLPIYAMAVERYIAGDSSSALFDVGYWGLKKDGFRSIRFEDWDKDQKALEDYLIEVARQLRDGIFPVNSMRQGCESYCEFRSICRVRQIRSANREPTHAFVAAISLSATASRSKKSAKESVPVTQTEIPGVVRAKAITPESGIEISS